MVGLTFHGMFLLLNLSPSRAYIGAVKNSNSSSVCDDLTYFLSIIIFCVSFFHKSQMNCSVKY